LEEASERGEQALLDAGVDEKWAAVVAELARAYVEIPRVRIGGFLELTCWKPNGIDAIKKALISAEKAAGNGDVSVEIYTVGAPRYKVEVTAKDYKQAEAALKKVVDTALAIIKSERGQGSFTREK
ncbi:MAG: translation initiation factor IF-2 subunit alpha, partial [Candidatus Freyarchaeota archaeon]